MDKVPDERLEGLDSNQPIVNALSNHLPHFEGHVDALSASGLTGWAAEGFDPAQVIVMVNGEPVGFCTGGTYRRDLIELERSPMSGFAFTFETRLQNGDVVSVVNNGGQHLINSPQHFRRKDTQESEDHRDHRANECHFFLHIPKSAGTSLRYQLKSRAEDVSFIYQDEFQDPIFIQAVRSRPLPKLFFGHFSYGVHKLIASAPRYACLLRDPFTRVVSLYAHQFASGSPDVRHLPYGNEGLKVFVQSIGGEQVNNHICRIITGIFSDHGIISRKKWLLEFALHNLSEHFQLAATVNQIDLVEKYFMAYADVKIDSVSRSNKTGMPPFEIDPKNIELITEFNSSDMQLFEQVCNRPILRI